MIPNLSKWIDTFEDMKKVCVYIIFYFIWLAIFLNISNKPGWHKAIKKKLSQKLLAK